jgi:hypothetical protein
MSTRKLVLSTAVGLLLLVAGAAVVVNAVVTGHPDPGPFHYHSGQANNEPDPATWVSSSANGGLATAFHLHGNLTSPDGEMHWSAAHAVDGATYEETIAGATPIAFEWSINLAVDISVWVDPHFVDDKTTYRTSASSNARLRVWLDGQLQDWSPQDPQEVVREQESSTLLEGTSSMVANGIFACTTFKFEYLTWGTVSLRTDRVENVIHGEAKTDHGDPADPIGSVQKWAGGNPQGTPVPLY